MPSFVQACPEDEDLCESEDELYPSEKVSEAIRAEDNLLDSPDFFDKIFNPTNCQVLEKDIALKNSFDL